MGGVRRCMCVTVVLAAISVLLAPAILAKVKIGPADEYDPQVDPASFVDGNGDPLPVDNQYWPLVPGTTFVYEDEDGEEHNEVYVTGDTKVILGVTCTVVLDREWEDDGEADGIWTDDELVEETLDWYAQDADGNVWYFGEYTTAYEDGGVSHEGSWEAGVDGALAGILMLGNPQTGDSYRQEYYEGEAEDMAKVLKLSASAEVAYGDFDDCLKTKEWTPLEAAVEHKYYAPGVGLVLIEELKGGTTRVELIDVL